MNSHTGIRVTDSQGFLYLGQTVAVRKEPNDLPVCIVKGPKDSVQEVARRECVLGINQSRVGKRRQHVIEAYFWSIQHASKIRATNVLAHAIQVGPEGSYVAQVCKRAIASEAEEDILGGV